MDAITAIRALECLLLGVLDEQAMSAPFFDVPEREYGDGLHWGFHARASWFLANVVHVIVAALNAEQ